MAVPIVATPGGVIQSFQQGTQSGLDLANAIMLNKRASPELAHLLQQTYNVINQQGQQPAQDDTQGGQPQTPDLSGLPGGQDQGQPQPDQQQAQAQAPQGQAQQPQQQSAPSAPNSTFLSHFHDRINNGEDPVMLGKEARLALEGHLPNHPALSNQGAQSQPNLSGLPGQQQSQSQQSQQAPQASQIDFGGLSNRDLLTARAMIGDLATFQARRSVAQTRGDVTRRGQDLRAQTAADANKTKRDLAGASEGRKAATAGTKATETERHNRAEEGIQQQRANAQDALNKIHSKIIEFHNSKSFDPKTQDGKNAIALYNGANNAYRDLLKTQGQFGKTAVSDDTIKQAKAAVDSAAQRLNQNGGQGQATQQDIPSNYIHISNGKGEEHWIDPKTEADAAKDGFKRVQ